MASPLALQFHAPRIDALIGPGREVDPVADTVQVVLLPEENPAGGLVDLLLELVPGRLLLRRVDQRAGLIDQLLERRITEAAVRAVPDEQVPDRALRIKRRAPAEHEHVAGIALDD